ncbi:MULTISPECIES: hypothetical protein [unclassified Coleofasciculus]|uniref:hypothetical protein n=2 Tax=Cyanobacteriota TaxID=1117 RepID=UPI001689A4DB|nr:MULTISPECIES: hypothetical protein [unclassified Coleofasciculus]MBD1879943.1 hypothetical protein [Coleofasciculus sp. FACHB-T130]MBD1896328.1 hypothetical protein [Coleofasciculus sp. FACHB-129]
MMPFVALSGQVALIPVIEFAPSDYCHSERSLPLGRVVENPHAWYRYWKESLADSELESIEPIRPGSWLVPISQLVEPFVLRHLVETYFEKLEIATSSPDLECIGSFSGGYVLCCNDDIVIEPTCCSGLEDIAAWEGAMTYRGEQWDELWIGHPWVSVRFASGNLCISGYHETSSSKLPNSATRYTVKPSVLEVAIRAAKAEVELFRQRLLSVVQKLTPAALASEIVCNLTGARSG